MKPSTVILRTVGLPLVALSAIFVGQRLFKSNPHKDIKPSINKELQKDSPTVVSPKVKTHGNSTGQ